MCGRYRRARHRGPEPRYGDQGVTRGHRGGGARVRRSHRPLRLYRDLPRPERVGSAVGVQGGRRGGREQVGEGAGPEGTRARGEGSIPLRETRKHIF